MGLLTGFAVTLGIAAMIGSISEALVADTKLEKYVRLIVAFFILIVMFSFVFKIDLTNMKLDYTPKEMVLPDAGSIAKAGVLSLSRVELGRKIQELLFHETGEAYEVTSLYMIEKEGALIPEKVLLKELFGQDTAVLEKMIYENLEIKITVEEESHE